MSNDASIKIDGKEFPYPMMIGSEGEKAVDVRNLRKDTGVIFYDQGYGNTGSCESQVTFLDGDRGILRHRGYPIEQLAQFSNYMETAYLVIYGELPTAVQRRKFGDLMRQNAFVEPQMQRLFEGYPKNTPPMVVLASLVMITRPIRNKCNKNKTF